MKCKECGSLDTHYWEERGEWYCWYCKDEIIIDEFIQQETEQGPLVFRYKVDDELHYQIFKHKFLEKYPESEENLILGFYLKFKKEKEEVPSTTKGGQ